MRCNSGNDTAGLVAMTYRNLIAPNSASRKICKA